ncbi:cardiac phospholamban [Narcine bancroftii]|uniref:cardiac phospholamban n=1 Tax=Narcine bancroftii TaxID=1343680 RepID=UPI003831F32A
MDKVQQITRSAMRRASALEVNPQVHQNVQGLFINFSLILICLLLMYIIKLLMY